MYSIVVRYLYNLWGQRLLLLVAFTHLSDIITYDNKWAQNSNLSELILDSRILLWSADIYLHSEECLLQTYLSKEGKERVWVVRGNRIRRAFLEFPWARGHDWSLGLRLLTEFSLQLWLNWNPFSALLPSLPTLSQGKTFASYFTDE